MKQSKPTKPLAPLLPSQPVTPTQPTQPAFHSNVGSTYDSVYDSYEKVKEATEPLVNAEEKANDIFDPFFNKAVRQKYEGDAIPDWIQAGAELVKNQWTAYDDGVLNGVFTNLGLVGESLDKVTGLPVRALINKAQTGESFWQTWGEGFTTNDSISGQDIRENMGIEFDSPFGNFLADMVTEVILDPTTWIGVGAATKVGKASNTLQTVAKGINTIEAGAGQLMKVTPLGAVGQATKLGTKVARDYQGKVAEPATIKTRQDYVDEIKNTAKEIEVEDLGVDEISMDRLKQNTKDLEGIFASHNQPVEMVEMDDLAKQQSVVDALFTDVTREYVGEEMGQSLFRTYDGVEFFKQINEDLSVGDTSRRKMVDDVLNNFTRFKEHENARLFPVANQYADAIIEQLQVAQQQFKKQDKLNELLSEDGLDLPYLTELFMEVVKERGVGGRWSEDMIYAWTHGVEEILHQLKRNKALTNEHPELKTIRHFFLGLENPRFGLPTEKEMEWAVKRVRELSEGKGLKQMDTSGFDFIFERRQGEPVTKPSMTQTLKAQMSEPGTVGYELNQLAVKIDRQINDKLTQQTHPAFRKSLRYALAQKLDQLGRMNVQDISRYTDDMELLRSMEEQLEELVVSLDEDVDPLTLMTLYEDYQTNVVDLVQYLKENQIKEIETGVDDLTYTLDDLVTLPSGLEQHLDRLMKTYREELTLQSRQNAHLQLNKQQNQQELVDMITQNDKVHALFSTYQDKNHSLSWMLEKLQDDIPSVKALKESFDSIISYQQFTQRMEQTILAESLDVKQVNEIKDSVYGYFDKLNKSTKRNKSLEKQITNTKTQIEALERMIKDRGETPTLRRNLSTEQTRLGMLEARRPKAKDVPFPHVLKPYEKLIKEYLEKVELNGYTIAHVPDGPFSSQLKHVSDDLKNHFPLMESIIKEKPTQEINELSKTGQWELEDLLAREAQLIEQSQDMIRNFQAVRMNTSELFDEAKSAIREQLKTYRDINRRMKHSFVSNEDARQFARSKGYQNIAEYLKFESPRVFIKNGAELEERIKLFSFATKLFPTDVNVRREWTTRMINHLEESKTNEEIALKIFLKELNNPTHTVPQAQRVQQEIYEKLFPNQSYQGDDYDKLMKDAIVRTEIITNPEKYVQYIADLYTPKVFQEDLKAEDFVDNLRQVANTFRDREYVEALHHIVHQATQDAWDYYHYQQVKGYQDLFDQVQPLNKENYLKEFQTNPVFQMKTHSMTNTFEKAREVFKANPHLTTVAVVEDKKNPLGVKIIQLRPTTQKAYEDAVRLNAMILDTETASHLRSLYKQNPLAGDQYKALRFWQKWFVQTYKVQALINVGFHLSNFLDIILKNVSQSPTGKIPQNVWQVLQSQYDMLRYNSLKHRDFSTLKSEEQKLVEEIAAFKKTLASGTELSSDQLREGRTNTEKFRQWMLYDNPISKGNLLLGNTIEEAGRLALYRQVRETGGGTASALHQVLSTHFDYSNKAPALQWGELIFPFLTFALRNAIYWSDMVVKNPKLVEYIYEGLLYNYSEYGYDVEDEDTYIGKTLSYNLANGNLIVPANTETGAMYLKNGNSLLGAMSLVGNPVDASISRVHPILKAMTGADTWVKAIPYQQQFRNTLNMLDKSDVFDERIYTIREALGWTESENELGFLNAIGSTYYKSYESQTRTAWSSQLYYKENYPDYPDYPKGQKYYPRYYGARSYNNFRKTRSYNFYKSLYTSTGKSRLAMRLTPTNYRNLEGRIQHIQYDMKY